MPAPEPTHQPPAEPRTEQELEEYQRQLEGWEADLQKFKADLNSHEETRQRVLEQRKSAEEEYDKLIVYLAAGGLVLTVGFVKDLTKAAETHQVGWLLGCWITFAAALIVNLASHALSRMAADAFLINQSNWSRLDRLVMWANWVALILVGLGVVAFLIFVFQNFPAHG
jgi:hypothetical protein